MSDKAKKIIRLSFGIILSLALIITGILLMVSCVNIYRLGSRPFTPENISAAFSKIAVPVWITVGAVVVGLIVNLILPAKNDKPKAIIDKRITLSRLQKRLNEEACDEETLAPIKKERGLRDVLSTVAVILSFATAIPAIIYVSNPNNFSMELNQSVISACLWVLPCTVMAMGICLALVYIEDASLGRQVTHVKAALAKTAVKSTAADTAAKKRTNTRLVTAIRIALAAVALIFIVIGIFNGGMADTLSKAINICTECIGLG